MESKAVSLHKFLILILFNFVTCGRMNLDPMNSLTSVKRLDSLGVHSTALERANTVVSVDTRGTKAGVSRRVHTPGVSSTPHQLHDASSNKHVITSAENKFGRADHEEWHNWNSARNFIMSFGNYLSTDDMLDGEHEIRLRFGRVTAKQTVVGPAQGSEGGLVVRQVSNGRQLLFLIYTGVVNTNNTARTLADRQQLQTQLQAHLQSQQLQSQQLQVQQLNTKQLHEQLQTQLQTEKLQRQQIQHLKKGTPEEIHTDIEVTGGDSKDNVAHITNMQDSLLTKDTILKTTAGAQLYAVMDSKSEFDATQTQIEDTQSHTEDTQAQSEDAQTQIEDTQSRIEDIQTQNEDAQIEIKDLQRKIEDVQRQIEDTQAQIADIQANNEPEDLLVLRDCDVENSEAAVTAFREQFEQESRDTQQDSVSLRVQNGSYVQLRALHRIPAEFRPMVHFKTLKRKCLAHKKSVRRSLKAAQRLQKKLEREQEERNELELEGKEDDSEEEDEDYFEDAEPMQTTRLEDTDVAVTGTHSRARRSLNDLFIMPGTLWCGLKHRATSAYELSGSISADSCCRLHDNCPYFIPSMSSKHGVFNYNFFSISHCGCDTRFRTCLMSSNTGAANLVGRVFFDMIRSDCFVFRKKQVCTRRSWFGRCQRYSIVRRAELRTPKPWTR